MKTFTLEEQKNAYKKLPESVQEELAEINVGQLAIDLGQKHSLHIDQVGNLIDITMCTIIGLLPSDQFNQNLKESLSLDEQKISPLIKEIDEQVFKRLRQKLAEKEETVLDKPIENPLADIVSKEDILKEIENPTPTFKPVPQTPAPVVEKPVIENKEPIFKEETVKTQQKVVDPYKESIE